MAGTRLGAHLYNLAHATLLRRSRHAGHRLLASRPPPHGPRPDLARPHPARTGSSAWASSTTTASRTPTSATVRTRQVTKPRSGDGRLNPVNEAIAWSHVRRGVAAGSRAALPRARSSSTNWISTARGNPGQGSSCPGRAGSGHRRGPRVATATSHVRAALALVQGAAAGHAGTARQDPARADDRASREQGHRVVHRGGSRLPPCWPPERPGRSLSITAGFRLVVLAAGRGDASPHARSSTPQSR